MRRRINELRASRCCKPSIGQRCCHFNKRKWNAQRAALYRTIFPQMTGCLPEDEGAQLRFDFEAELARLEAA